MGATLELGAAKDCFEHSYIVDSCTNGLLKYLEILDG